MLAYSECAADEVILVNLNEVISTAQSYLQDDQTELPWEGSNRDKGAASFRVTIKPKPAAATGSQQTATPKPKPWLPLLNSAATKYCSREASGAYHTKRVSMDATHQSAWDLGLEACVATVHKDYPQADLQDVRNSLNKCECYLLRCTIGAEGSFLASAVCEPRGCRHLLDGQTLSRRLLPTGRPSTACVHSGF